MMKCKHYKNKKLQEIKNGANVELKNRIIEAALQMFYEEGIKSVRMDDIAVRCGISKRTLYENFADREELVRQCIGYHVEKYKALVGNKLPETENAIHEFWIIFGLGTEFRSANQMVMSDLLKFYPHIFNEFIKMHHHHIIENNKLRFERGQKEGLILKNIDTALFARNLTSYLYGLQRNLVDMSWEDVDKSTYMSPKAVQFTIMMFLRGAATERGRKYIDNTLFQGLE